MPALRARLDAVRISPVIDYPRVRDLKHDARCGVRSRTSAIVSGTGGTQRAAAFRAYMRASSRGGSTITRSSARCTRGTRNGPGPTGRTALRDRHPRRSTAARAELADDILFDSTCSGWPASSGPRARRDAAPVALLRRPAVHGQRRQRRRLGAAGRVPARRVGRRAARRLQRHRPGLGPAGLPLGRVRRARLRLAARSRAAQRRPLRRLPRRSPGRLLSHLLPPARRRRARSSRRPTSPSRRRSANACSACSASPAPRSSPRISASCPTSSASRSTRLGVPGYKVFRWERCWHDRRPAVPRSGRLPGRVRRHVGHARHRADGHLVGEARRPRNGRRCSRSRRCTRL